MPELDVEADAVVDAIDDALIVLDEDGDIIDYNEAFADAVRADRTESVSAALDDCPALKTHLQQREEGVVAVETPDRKQYYNLGISTIDTVTDGVLVVLRDVTDEQRHCRELERENEQLDQFASLISHDLRNPLDVAIGRTTAVGEITNDAEVKTHVDEIRSSHSRMLRIIQDVLTLARQGQHIDDKATVQLADAATDAWQHVDTDGATLDLQTDQAVLADRNRLVQVFENLFRNSVEHGADSASTTVTVAVGTLGDSQGFYVADDGTGIDPSIRSQVLEAGFSDEDSTGLGLAIVSKVVDAHGWDVTVCDSESGGARFEFSGVERPETQ